MDSVNNNNINISNLSSNNKQQVESDSQSITLTTNSNSNLNLTDNLLPPTNKNNSNTNIQTLSKNKNTTLKSILIDYLNKFEELESYPLDKTDCGYVKEFYALKELSENLKKDKSNLSAGEKEYNLRKNRYTDILPFNHTRVILSDHPQILGSDYINANFIEGSSDSPKAYIACQGPLTSTVSDFWRMIWECDVSIVIMACNEHEFGQSKCEIYWPEQLYNAQTYGNIEVTLIREKPICADFLIRKFCVKVLGNKPILIDSNNCESFLEQESRLDMGRSVLLERTICQFHYTTWPDHGVPNSVQPILELVKLVRNVQTSEDKPLLVHCSAGCGRTGTICCIDFVFGLLRRGKIEPNFNLCRIISDMRHQRMAMVQTLDQYILCYRAVASLFVQQLQLIDNHHYENLDTSGEPFSANISDSESDVDSDFESGPVFI